MVDSLYVPDTGDIVWLDFSPQAGHEQWGHRPALVLSSSVYNGRTKLGVFCPITSTIRDYPFEVRLPDSLSTSGVVLADQIKSLDWHEREAQLIERAPLQVIAEVKMKIAALLGFSE